MNNVREINIRWEWEKENIEHLEIRLGVDRKTHLTIPSS